MADPNFGNVARHRRLQLLSIRLEDLVATGVAINAEDPELIDALFTTPEQTATVVIRDRVEAARDALRETMDIAT